MTDVKVLELVVAGAAQQQGSVRGFVPQKNGQPLRRANGSIVVNLTSDNTALRKWRKGVAELAAAALLEADPDAHAAAYWPVPKVGFTVSEVAYFRRPDGHWGTGRNAHLLKPSAPARPVTQPGGQQDMATDVDKLLRAALDALTGVVWADDSQVTDGIARKRYAVPDDRGDGVLAVLQVWRNGVQRAEDLPWAERVRGAWRVLRGVPEAADELRLV